MKIKGYKYVDDEDLEFFTTICLSRYGSTLSRVDRIYRLLEHTERIRADLDKQGQLCKDEDNNTCVQEEPESGIIMETRINHFNRILSIMTKPMTAEKIRTCLMNRGFSYHITFVRNLLKRMDTHNLVKFEQGTNSRGGKLYIWHKIDGAKLPKVGPHNMKNNMLRGKEMRKEIIRILDKPMTTQEIIEALGGKTGNIHSYLRKLLCNKQISRKVPKKRNVGHSWFRTDNKETP